jgi:internalin A
MPTRPRKRNPKYGLAEAELRIAKCATGIPHLDLSDLGLTHVPELVGSLRWLVDLDLQNNQITELPEFIGELTNLRSLILWGNPIEFIPKALTRLINLKQLVVGGRRTAPSIPDLSPLRNLTTLVLVEIGLRRFPDWILNLSKLQTLFIYGNQLIELPSGIRKLRNLTRLIINHNKLKALPVSLLELNKLRELRISGNPLGIPAEIADSANAEKILSYYFRTAVRGAGQPLNEFKLILVGRGGVGKTTLVHRLVTDKYKEFKRTPGIKITKWPVQIDDDEVRAHIWDFGGQEIMHGTHRFFMTERALYLVLISGREGTEDHDAEYWLSLVRSFAGNVPIIVLLNKWDDYTFELNRQLLREKYGRKLVFVETDSFTGTGMSELRQRICQLAKRLPGLRAAWPTEWRRIKEELPRKKKSWLTFEDFRAFCEKEHIVKPRIRKSLLIAFMTLVLCFHIEKKKHFETLECLIRNG